MQKESREHPLPAKTLFVSEGFSAQFDVVFRVFSAFFQLFRCHGFHNFGGASQQDGAVGGVGLSGDQCIGTHKTTVSQHSTGKNDGTHADEAFIADGADKVSTASLLR